MTKTCRTCRQPKDNSEFSVDKSKKDKLCRKCKDCQREYDQDNWADRIVKSSRQHDNNYHRPIDSDDYIDSKWVEELVRNKPNCHYCDVTLKYGVGIDRNTNPDGLQLDRMDSSLEHTKLNCVQCCKTCNQRCKTMPYKWKALSGGGNFAHFDMKWCPSYLHNGGDEGNHVLSIGEFDADDGRKNGLAVYCRSCKEHYNTTSNEEQRTLKKLKTS